MYDHYSYVIMGAIASQITSLTIVYLTIYSGADQRKHQSSASLAFVRGIPRWSVNSPHKWPVTRKCFHMMTSSCCLDVELKTYQITNDGRKIRKRIMRMRDICKIKTYTWGISGLMVIGPHQNNFTEIGIKTYRYTFSFTNMYLECHLQPLCSGPVMYQGLSQWETTLQMKGLASLAKTLAISR